MTELGRLLIARWAGCTGCERHAATPVGATGLTMDIRAIFPDSGD
jgi:hypothetical protein